MKWLRVYGLPKLPLFLARLAMRIGLPGPTWYKWKAASAGTGVILDEMIRAADDLGYDGRFFDIEITLTETKDGEYVINADRCPWFGGMGQEGVEGWDVKPCAAFSTYEKAMVNAINPNVKLSYTEKRTTGGHTCRGVYQYRDKELGDGPESGVTPEMVQLVKKPKKGVEAKTE
jgi:hypothetical protein